MFELSETLVLEALPLHNSDPSMSISSYPSSKAPCLGMGWPAQLWQGGEEQQSSPRVKSFPENTRKETISKGPTAYLRTEKGLQWRVVSSAVERKLPGNSSRDCLHFLRELAPAGLWGPSWWGYLHIISTCYNLLCHGGHSALPGTPNGNSSWLPQGSFPDWFLLDTGSSQSDGVTYGMMETRGCTRKPGLPLSTATSRTRNIFRTHHCGDKASMWASFPAGSVLPSLVYKECWLLKVQTSAGACGDGKILFPKFHRTPTSGGVLQSPRS